MYEATVCILQAVAFFLQKHSYNPNYSTRCCAELLTPHLAKAEKA